VAVNSRVPLAADQNPNAVGRLGNMIPQEALRIGPRYTVSEPVQTWNVRIDRIAQFMMGDVLNSRYLASAHAPIWLSSDARPELWPEVISLGGNGYDATYVFVKLIAQAVRRAAMVRRGVVPPNVPAVVNFDWAITYTGPPANANIAELRRTCSNGALTWAYPNDLWTAATIVVLRMLAEGGRVWPTPAGQRITVMDDLEWDEVPINLVSPSGLPMPTAAATAVSVSDILGFAEHLAANYKIYSCYYRGLNIVASTAGARWALVPLFGNWPAREEGRRHPGDAS